MKRPLHADEVDLWRQVTRTIRPLGAREQGLALPPPAFAAALTPPPAPVSGAPAKTLEPRRHARLKRGRDAVAASLDLHGMTQDAARAALFRFLGRAQADGARAVVVITGRGLMGDGILRRRAPEWLAEPALADIVAGVAEAHRRHGGAGALYVALKRRRA
ncbi:MAG TPA: Smr/MutS family protein [Caulobacteraceae bacterium]|nr:Smr/MutS family protein [Caulobacteraceae bacterium]